MFIINNYINVLKNYTKFSGRTTRKEYWYFVLANTIVSFIVMFLDNALNFNVLSIVYSLVVLIPSLAVGVRRMHDINKSGWFYIIPIYNLILACTKSTPGDNRFGAENKV